MARRFTRRTLLGRSVVAAGLLGTLGSSLSSLSLAAPGKREIPTVDFVDGASEGPVTGQPRALPAGASHVGIHWRGEAHKIAAVSARIQTASGWSEWIELSIEDDPFGMDETFAALLDVRGASAVQYRVTLPRSRRLDQVVVTAISADERAPTALSPFLRTAFADATTWSFTTPDGLSQLVTTRAGWGCDETLSYSAQGTHLWPAMFVPTKKLLVHHTATSNRYSDGAAEVRAIHVYHAKTKGWGDVGYNALVDRFGNVYEGRRGRETTPREILSMGVVAGHCFGHNYGTTGVAVIGDFTKRKINTSDSNDQAMLAALENLAVWECGRAGMRADGSSEFLKSDDTWRDGMATVSGHRDNESTQCPGSALYSYLPTLRSRAATRLATYAQPAVTLGRSTSRQITAPGSVTFAWSSASAVASEYRLEGWKKKNADDIYYWSGAGWSDTEPSGWTPAGASGEVLLSNLVYGHYTLHVRGLDAQGRAAAVEANGTLLVTGAWEPDPNVTPTATATATAQLSATSTATATVEPSVTPTATATALLTTEPTPSPTSQATLEPTASATATPPAPTLSLQSITPNQVAAGGSENVRIAGTGFVAGATVSFQNGSGPSPSATVTGANADGTALYATIAVPSGGPPRNRVWDVRVTNPDSSTAVLAQSFTVLR